MLRRTAARAFASGDEAKAPVAPPAREGTRESAIERLFRELHRAIEEAVAAHGAGGGAEGAPRVMPLRSSADGVTFVLEGRTLAFRFLDALNGQIEVSRRAGERFEPDAVLSVQLRGGVFEPIWKPVESGARTGFRFASVRELAASYLRTAERSPLPQHRSQDRS